MMISFAAQAQIPRHYKASLKASFHVHQAGRVSAPCGPHTAPPAPPAMQIISMINFSQYSMLGAGLEPSPRMPVSTRCLESWLQASDQLTPHACFPATKRSNTSPFRPDLTIKSRFEALAANLAIHGAFRQRPAVRCRLSGPLPHKPLNPHRPT